ncbi:MAG: CrcB family protein, partial [Pseudomonadota bacterium]|nr:CrcB family protein [Pseudomonadota bacterium]
MKTVLAIAAGGALGAVARYYVSIGTGVLLGTAFPWGTLFVNLIGCFAMGVL